MYSKEDIEDIECLIEEKKEEKKINKKLIIEQLEGKINLKNFVSGYPPRLLTSLQLYLGFDFDSYVAQSETIEANNYYLRLTHGWNLKKIKKYEERYNIFDRVFWLVKPMTKKLTVYRGIKLEEPTELKVTSLSYMSTTINFKVMEGFIKSKCCYMHITILPGVKAIAIHAPLSEKEILLEKGGMIYVTSIETIDDKILIKASYISQYSPIVVFKLWERSNTFVNIIIKNWDLNCLIIPSVWWTYPLNEEINKKIYNDHYIEDVKKCTKLNVHITNKLYLIKKFRREKQYYRLLTYNVHEFKNFSGENKKGDIIDNIIAVDADIVLLQESNSQSVEELLNIYQYQYSVQSEQYVVLYIVLLSKFPIIKKSIITLSNNRYALYAKIEIENKNDDIDIYGVHFSTGISYKEREKEALQLINYINEKNNNNRFILGDFNTIDPSEYTKLELDWIVNHWFKEYEDIDDSTIYNLLLLKSLKVHDIKFYIDNKIKDYKSDKTIFEIEYELKYTKQIKLKTDIDKNFILKLERKHKRQKKMKVNRTNLINDNSKFKNANVNNIKYTSVFGKKVDHILFNHNIYKNVFSAAYNSTSSDHLPYFADFEKI